MSSLLSAGKIGSILYQCEIITEKDIETALAEQKRTGLRFGEVLVRLGIVRQEDIDWALSHQLDIPYVRIRQETVDPNAIDLVPASVARKFDLLPLIRTGDELRIAMADPLNKEAIVEVERVSGCSVSISMGLVREIREMQNHFYGGAVEKDFFGFSSTCFPATVLEIINNDATGAKLLHYLLLFILQKGLSSLSLKPLKDHVLVTGKRGSSAQTLGTLFLTHYGEFLSLVKKRSGIAGGDELSADGSLNFELKETRAQFQVSLLQLGAWEYLTLRPLVSTRFPESLATLEASEQTRQTLRKLAACSEGMVLFASTEGEERARLMGVLLEEFSGSGREALLLGKRFAFCNSRFPVASVERGTMDLAQWIRAALVHDPSLVAVEEIADAAEFAAAFDFVLSGKLLFGGVFAPDVRSALRQLTVLRDRLPMFPLYLRGVVACRGVHVLCPVCREEDHSPAPLVPFLQNKPPALFFRPKGCPSCGYTGYAGKRYLVEAALFDQELAELLGRWSGDINDIMPHLVRRGFHGISEEAVTMLYAGEITAAEYISATMENGER